MADKLVKVYYLGGFVTDNPRVTAKGHNYKVPNKGGYLEVKDFIARDLIRRNRTPLGQSVFTTDKRFVDAVLNREKVAPTMETPKLSREALLEMLAELDGENAEDTAPRRKTKAEKEAEMKESEAVV